MKNNAVFSSANSNVHIACFPGFGVSYHTLKDAIMILHSTYELTRTAPGKLQNLFHCSEKQ